MGSLDKAKRAAHQAEAATETIPGASSPPPGGPAESIPGTLTAPPGAGESVPGTFSTVSEVPSGPPPEPAGPPSASMLGDAAVPTPGPSLGALEEATDGEPTVSPPVVQAPTGPSGPPPGTPGPAPGTHGPRGA